MSIVKEVIVQVQCDKCNKLHPITGDGARAAKDFAREAGWKLGKQKDYCPQCSADINEQIRKIREGS